MNHGVNGKNLLRMLFGNRMRFLAACAVIAVTGAGCLTKPMGADRVSTRLFYDQVAADALNSGRPSAATVSLLHQYDLDWLAEHSPDEAVRKLHERAVSAGDRDLLFALAELSYVAGERIRGSLKPADHQRVAAHPARTFEVGAMKLRTPQSHRPDLFLLRPVA